MAPRHLLAMVAGLALGAVGCAHCDTCDDFPIPCSGGDCGGMVYSDTPGIIGPPMAAPGVGPAPAMGPGPFTSTPVRPTVSSQPTGVVADTPPTMPAPPQG